MNGPAAPSPHPSQASNAPSAADPRASSGTGTPSTPATAATPSGPLRRPGRLLLLCLALVFAGALGAHLFKTDFGRVVVTGIKLPTQNGQWLTADVFRPRTATEKTPAPLVVVCPGFERSKETLDSYSIELARRGIVVIAIDPYNQGASSATRQRRSASLEGYGVIPMVDYAHGTPNLNYIDKARIGAAGYSAGGNAVLQAASVFGKRARGSTAANKLAGVFVGGYVLSLTDEVLASVNTNVCVDYAVLDEGGFRNVLRHADLRRAPEALRLVNAVLPADAKISEVRIDHPYGDPSAGTLRLVHNTPDNIHPLLPYDPRSIAHLVRYFSTVFSLQPALAPRDQVWFYKELCTLVSLVGGLLSLLPLTALLLRWPVFRPLVHPVPPPLPAPSRKGWFIFWTVFVATALVACFLFVPMARATFVLFPTASNAYQTWWFPQRINNAVLLWAVANGALGIGVFFLVNRLFSRRNGVTPDMLGLRVGAGEIVRALALALVVLSSFYAVLFAVYAVFHVDYRFFFVAATPEFPVKMLLVALEYLPLFFVFYVANSIRVNAASRFAGQREWVSLLVMGLGNSVGLMLILVIQYAHFFARGEVYWTHEWLYVNLLLGIIPMMFLLPYFNRAFFRMTGRVYLGPMITCLVFIMMMLTTNVCYIPLP